MKISLLFIFLLVNTYCYCQKFDGFVITQEDSLFKGYMIFSSAGGKGTQVLITNDKKKRPRSYLVKDLKYYAYKKDTFALLHAFYPFEGEDYMASGIEGKFVISKGSVKLYHAEFPDYNKIIAGPGLMVGIGGVSVGVGRGNNKAPYSTYVIRDREGNLHGIKGKKEEFFRLIEIALGDDFELMKRIQSNELGYKDIKEIVKIYNTNRLVHP